MPAIADSISYYFVLSFPPCLCQIDCHHMSGKGTCEIYDMIHSIKGQNEMKLCLTLQEQVTHHNYNICYWENKTSNALKEKTETSVKVIQISVAVSPMQCDGVRAKTIVKRGRWNILLWSHHTTWGADAGEVRFLCFPSAAAYSICF